MMVMVMVMVMITYVPVEWKVARWAESGSWGADSLAHSLSLWGKFTLDFADDTSLPIAMIATQNMQTQLQRQYPLKYPLYRNDSLSTFLFPDCILQVVQLNI